MLAWTRRTVSWLAISPAAWPPIPSQTIYSPRSGSIRQASSLWLRWRPTSVCPEAVIRMYVSLGRRSNARGSAALYAYYGQQTSRCPPILISRPQGGMPRPLERGEHPHHVSGGGRREQLRPHVCCAWEASTIPAQVFAHGLKRHAIVETLEVAGMLQGHLAALAYRDVWWLRRSGRHRELLPHPGFGTKYPGISQG